MTPGLGDTNRFLAPNIEQSYLREETASCVDCQEIRTRSNIAGAVCFTHFLKVRQTGGEDSAREP